MLNLFRKFSRYFLILFIAFAVSFSNISQAYCYEAAGSRNVLQQALDRAAKIAAQGKNALIVFDLDDTLFSPAMRMRQVLIDFAANTPGVPSGLKAKAEALTEATACYEIDDTIKNMDVTDKELAKKIKDFYNEQAYTSKYLKYDVPNTGAVEYVKAARMCGAKVCYLTGRDDDRMGEGTIASLKDSGFPYGDTGTVLILKKEPVSSVKFKKEELVKLMKDGAIVASFDNEPKNVNMMKETLGKDCLVIYLKTRHSGNAVPVEPGILEVDNFSLSK